MDFRILIPPIIGAIIGYITNDIAIKMLFHPRKPIYIGRWQLPFTPGLIPKEKHRVARSIGNVVSNQLLNSDTLVNVLTSDDMLQKMRNSMEAVIEKNRINEDTIEDTLLKVAPAEVVDNTVSDIKENTTSLVYGKLVGMHFGEAISIHILQKLNYKLGEMTRGVLASFFDENLVKSVAVSIGEMIDKAISDHSREIVETVIGKETDKLMNTRICDLIAQYEDKLPSAMDFIVDTYVGTVKNNLAQVLQGINLAKVVEDKIASFDVVQLEQMIFGIMKKELNAIVYLGALLGFLMGWITPLLGM